MRLTSKAATFTVAVTTVAALTACGGNETKSDSSTATSKQPATPAPSATRQGISVPKAIVVDDNTPKGEATAGMLLFGISTGGSDYSRSCRIVGVKDGKAVVLGDYDPTVVGQAKTVLACDDTRQFAPDGSYAVTTNGDDKVVVIFADGTTKVVGGGDGVHTLPAVNPADGRIWYWVRKNTFSFEMRSVEPDGTDDKVERPAETVTIDTNATRSEVNLAPGDQFTFVNGFPVNTTLTHDERKRVTLTTAGNAAVYEDKEQKFHVGSPKTVQTNPVYAVTGDVTPFSLRTMLDANTVVGVADDRVVVGKINLTTKNIAITQVTKNLRKELRLFPDYTNQLGTASVTAITGNVLFGLITSPREHDDLLQTHVLQVNDKGATSFVVNLQISDGKEGVATLLGSVA